MTLNRANNRIKKAIRLIAVMSVTALSFIHISAASAQTPVDETAFSSLRFRSREEYVAFIKPIAKKVGLNYAGRTAVYVLR